MKLSKLFQICAFENNWEVAGLYDLINGVFYTNAGTGTFIVGGNV